MELRYHYDPDTDLPHIYGHGITEREVEEVLRGPGNDYPAKRDSRMKVGQTAGGRYLQVVYVPDEDGMGGVCYHCVRNPRQEKEGVSKATTEERAMKKQQKLPKGWDEKRIQEVIDHYENQTDAERLAEIQAARKAKNITMVAVPTELVPKVRAMIARKAKRLVSVER